MLHRECITEIYFCNKGRLGLLPGGISVGDCKRYGWEKSWGRGYSVGVWRSVLSENLAFMRVAGRFFPTFIFTWGLTYRGGVRQGVLPKPAITNWPSRVPDGPLGRMNAGFFLRRLRLNPGVTRLIEGEFGDVRGYLCVSGGMGAREGPVWRLGGWGWGRVPL